LLVCELMLTAGVVCECGLRLVLHGHRLQQLVQFGVDLALGQAGLQLYHLD
jgi:hypothetical protein